MKENIFRGVIAAAVAGAAAYFQELALPVAVLFLVMVVDYISGMVRAWTRGELCSRVGIMGIVKGRLSPGRRRGDCGRLGGTDGGGPDRGRFRRILLFWPPRDNLARSQ